METAQSIVTLWFLEDVCIYTDGEQLASCLASKPSGSVNDIACQTDCIPRSHIVYIKTTGFLFMMQ